MRVLTSVAAATAIMLSANVAMAACDAGEVHIKFTANTHATLANRTNGNPGYTLNWFHKKTYAFVKGKKGPCYRSMVNFVKNISINDLIAIGNHPPPKPHTALDQSIGLCGRIVK